MSFKYDLSNKKIPAKITRRDHSVLSNEYHHHEGETEMGRKKDRKSKGDWEEGSDDINHSYTKEDGDMEGEPECISSSATQFILRIIVCLIVGIALVAASFAPGLLPKEAIPCIRDELFVLTTGVNQYFAEYTNVKNAFLIFCSLCMDITMVVGFVVFAIHGKTWRLPIALAMFYGLRVIIQKTFLMRYPEGYLWDYPGFPSLVVPYGKTNDFFYSGHAGGATVMMLEFRSLAETLVRHRVFMRGMQIFAILTITLQIFLMIFLRGHYTIDLITGLIFGHYFTIIAQEFAPYFDTTICKLKSKISPTNGHVEKREGHDKSLSSAELHKTLAGTK